VGGIKVAICDLRRGTGRARPKRPIGFVTDEGKGKKG
jgi:hypothetical protein